MQKISSGRRGEIFLEEVEGKKIATKKALDNSKKAAINKEILIINKLNKLKINFVPHIQEEGDGYFSYFYIEGVHFNKIFDKADLNFKKKLSLELLEKVYILDKNGIIHGELNRPHGNVLVDLHNSSDFDIYIIDFERGKIGDFTGTNLRGYAQWLRSNGYLSVEEVKFIGTLHTSDDIYNYLKRMMNNSLTLKKILKSKYINIGISVFFLIILDQLSKLFFYNYRIGNDFSFLTPLFNKGISWGVLVNIYFINIVSIIAVGVFLYFYQNRYLSKRQFILLISGTIGNFLDRLFLGGVRDFIDFKIWPVFNFADIYLTLGVVFILYKEFLSNGKLKIKNGK